MGAIRRHRRLGGHAGMTDQMTALDRLKTSCRSTTAAVMPMSCTARCCARSTARMLGLDPALHRRHRTFHGQHRMIALRLNLHRDAQMTADAMARACQLKSAPSSVSPGINADLARAFRQCRGEYRQLRRNPARARSVPISIGTINSPNCSRSAGVLTA